MTKAAVGLSHTRLTPQIPQSDSSMICMSSKPWPETALHEPTSQLCGGGGKLLDHWIISWWLDVYFAELRGFWSILQKSYRKNVAKIQRQGTIFAIHADNARRNWDCILSNSCRIVLGEDATWYWSRQVVARGWQFLDESSKRSGGNTFENTPSETSREMS